MTITPDDFATLVNAEIAKYQEMGTRVVDGPSNGLFSRRYMNSGDKFNPFTDVGFTAGIETFDLPEAKRPYSRYDQIRVAVEYPILISEAEFDQREAVKDVLPRGVISLALGSEGIGIEYIATATFDLSGDRCEEVELSERGHTMLPSLVRAKGKNMREGVQYLIETIYATRGTLSRMLKKQ